jgi:peptidoglycan/LPS O-acetylase OafA/YrhL
MRRRSDFQSARLPIVGGRGRGSADVVIGGQSRSQVRRVAWVMQVGSIASVWLPRRQRLLPRSVREAVLLPAVLVALILATVVLALALLVAVAVLLVSVLVALLCFLVLRARPPGGP